MRLLLEAQGLTVHYGTDRGTIQALKEVSFKVKTGEVLGIVGESGSGKTTLALHLMRFLPRNTILSAGKFFLEGLDCFTLGGGEFRRQVRWRWLSMVFQGALEALNPVLRVGEQVMEPLLMDGVVSVKEARQRAREALTRVALPANVYERYPHELSGGMKQRVIIAMALILNPKVIILDEPTSALDVIIQAQIMNLLKELKTQLNLSGLFITHDIALASDLCDKLGVLYAGRLVEIGPAEVILGHPRHPYTEGLLASLPRLHFQTRPKPIRGIPPDSVSPPPGCPFHPRCPYAFDLCQREMPPAFSFTLEHSTYCWLHK